MERELRNTGAMHQRKGSDKQGSSSLLRWPEYLSEYWRAAGVGLQVLVVRTGCGMSLLITSQWRTKQSYQRRVEEEMLRFRKRQGHLENSHQVIWITLPKRTYKPKAAGARWHWRSTWVNDHGFIKWEESDWFFLSSATVRCSEEDNHLWIDWALAKWISGACAGKGASCVTWNLS